ncbi:hypothetical protein BBR01nite_34810 [Brevibacillus brevis]|nr:hypothetical protein BBR01nite_34810 [Brevibacillus brevis]
MAKEYQTILPNQSPFYNKEDKPRLYGGGKALETLYKVLIGLCVLFIAAGVYYMS